MASNERKFAIKIIDDLNKSLTKKLSVRSKFKDLNFIVNQEEKKEFVKKLIDFVKNNNRLKKKEMVMRIKNMIKEKIGRALSTDISSDESSSNESSSSESSSSESSSSESSSSESSSAEEQPDILSFENINRQLIDKILKIDEDNEKKFKKTKKKINNIKGKLKKEKKASSPVLVKLLVKKDKEEKELLNFQQNAIHKIVPLIGKDITLKKKQTHSKFKKLLNDAFSAYQGVNEDKRASGNLPPNSKSKLKLLSRDNREKAKNQIKFIHQFYTKHERQLNISGLKNRSQVAGKISDESVRTLKGKKPETKEQDIPPITPPESEERGIVSRLQPEFKNQLKKMATETIGKALPADMPEGVKKEIKKEAGLFFNWVASGDAGGMTKKEREQIAGGLREFFKKEDIDVKGNKISFFEKMGEFHPPFHSFAGPFTQVEKRIKSLYDPENFRNALPFTIVDLFAFEHDLKYSSQDPLIRQKADRNMLKQMDPFYGKVGLPLDLSYFFIKSKKILEQDFKLPLIKSLSGNPKIRKLREEEEKRIEDFINLYKKTIFTIIDLPNDGSPRKFKTQTLELKKQRETLLKELSREIDPFFEFVEKINKIEEGVEDELTNVRIEQIQQKIKEVQSVVPSEEKGEVKIVADKLNNFITKSIEEKMSGVPTFGRSIPSGELPPPTGGEVKEEKGPVLEEKQTQQTVFGGAGDDGKQALFTPKKVDASGLKSEEEKKQDKQTVDDLHKFRPDFKVIQDKDIERETAPLGSQEIKDETIDFDYYPVSGVRGKTVKNNSVYADGVVMNNIVSQYPTANFRQIGEVERVGYMKPLKVKYNGDAERKAYMSMEKKPVLKLQLPMEEITPALKPQMYNVEPPLNVSRTEPWRFSNQMLFVDNWLKSHYLGGDEGSQPIEVQSKGERKQRKPQADTVPVQVKDGVSGKGEPKETIQTAVGMGTMNFDPVVSV